MKIILNSISLAMLTLVAAGCSTSPPVAMKTEELPKAYTAPYVTGAQKELSTEWWKSFSSPELTGFVEAASTGNLDLAVSAARCCRPRRRPARRRPRCFPALI